MAKNRIKGITVEIGGDTTKLSKALEGVDKNIRNTQSQLKDVEKLLKLDPTNTELLSQKQRLLSEAVEDTKDRLDALKTASEKAARTAGNYDAWKAKYDPIKEEITKTEDKLKDLKKESAEADKQLANGKITQEKYDSIQQEIKDTETQLASLKDAAKAVDEEFGKPISPEQFDALQREIIETEHELQNLQEEAANSNVALSRIGAIGGQMQEVGDKISGVGQKLMPVTGAVLGIGAAAVKTGAEFDSEMSKVKAISGTVADKDLPAIIEVAEGMALAFEDGADATETAMNIIEAKTREVGSQSKYSAYEVGEAFEFMAMAGWDQVAMLYGIEGVTNLAASNNMDLGEACDIVTDAMTAMGMAADESGHFADILAAASSNTNTNVSMLGESFKYAAPLAGAMEASAKDLSIALGLMANSGIKGSQAGNSLKNALVNLVKPTEQQAEAMKALGLITTEAVNVIDNDKVEKAQTKVANKTLDLEKAQISYNNAVTKYGAASSQAQKALLNVEKAENNLIQAQNDLNTAQQGTIEYIETGQNAFFKEGGEIKSLGEIMEVLRSTMGKVNVELVDSEGNLREYDDIIADLEQREDGLTQAEQLKNAAIIFGKQNLSGMLAIINASEKDYNDLTEAIYGCEGTAKNMADTMQDNLQGQLTVLKSQLDELAISFSKLLMPAIREIVSKIQALVDKFNAMSPAVKETIIKIALVAAALGPLLIVVGKTVSSIGILMQAIAKVPALLTKLKTGFAAVKAAIVGISAPVVAVVAIIAVLVAAFRHLWDTNEEFRNAITTIWNNIVTKLNTFFQSITDRLNALGFDFESITDVIKAVWDGFCSMLAPVFTSAFALIADTLSFVLDWLLNAFDVFSAIFSGDWEKAWDGIRNNFKIIWDYICKVFKNVFGMLTGIWDAFFGLFGSSWEEAWTSVKDFFVRTWEWIQEKLYGFFDAFILGWNTIRTRFSDIHNSIKNGAVKIWVSILTAITDKVTSIKNTVVNGFNQAVSFIKNLAGDAWSWGADIISGIVNGIKSKISSIKETVIDVANTIREFLHFSVPDKGPLTDFESWMPDFMQGLAKGIRKNQKYVEKAVSGVAEAMKITMSIHPDYTLDKIKDAKLNGMAAGTVNNYYSTDNSRTVNQTNNSPKALSRLEIYRQTRNAVNE